MTRSLRPAPGPLLAVLLTCSCAAGQTEYPYYQPKLQNAKDGAVHDFPLGVLSGTGRLKHGDTAILVKHLGEDGPAQQGGLQEGDLIVSIERKRMPRYSSDLDSGLLGPQTVLATALDKGCSLNEPKLKLTVMRKNKPIHLEIPLPPSPRYARGFPVKCEKTEAYRTAVSQWLVHNQRPDGAWRGASAETIVTIWSRCADWHFSVPPNKNI